MRVLAVDTAFEACSAAILDGEAVLWREQRIIGRGHAEAVAPMVAGGLSAAGLRAADLDRIGVVIGPGAFAGIRVGLALVRGLCLGTGLHAVGVTSLEALAASTPEREGPIAPVFDARRGQVYAALYDEAGNERVAPFVAGPAEAAARLAGAARLSGSGAPLTAPFMDARIAILPMRHIDPVAVARLALCAAKPVGPPAPLYLRPPDARPSQRSAFIGAPP